MKGKIFNCCALIIGLLINLNGSVSAQKPEEYDIVVYGGTSAGISAAIQASRLGKTVLVIEPSNRIGGLTTGSIRMEPVFMVLGQSAAAAACMAIDKNILLQEVPYAELRTLLLSNKQRLENSWIK